MIKKSVYVNIPSRISKETGIAKGSVLNIALEGDRVILSKDHDEKKVVTNQTPMLDQEGKPNNYTSGEGNLKRMLEEDYW